MKVRTDALLSQLDASLAAAIWRCPVALDLAATAYQTSRLLRLRYLAHGGDG